MDAPLKAELICLTAVLGMELESFAHWVPQLSTYLYHQASDLDIMYFLTS